MVENNKRILYVEDDVDSRDVMRLLLHEEGFEVVTAASVAEALSLARTQRFHLYILDNWFEQGSGVELCRQIRRFDRRTPILFCSGVASNSEIHEALDCGAQAYMVKPVDFDRLPQLIATLLLQTPAEL